MSHFTFNGISSNGKFRVNNITRSLTAPSEVSIHTIEGSDKRSLLSKRRGIRQINIDVTVIGESANNLRVKTREIGAWLDTDEPKVLIFNDESDKREIAVLDGNTDLEELMTIGQGTITFTLLNTFSESVNPTTVNLTGTMNHTVIGTAHTYPIITATATSSQPSFTISRTQNGITESVTITHAFASTNTLVIDMKNGSIKINGQDRMATMSYLSDFFDLKSGVNSLTVSSGFTVSVSYNNRWK